MKSQHICTRCITLRIRGDFDGREYTTYLPLEHGHRVCLHLWHPLREECTIENARNIALAHRYARRRKLNALDKIILYSLIAGTVLAIATNLTGA